MPSPYRIEGYAIVTEDGMLADAGRVMPDSLKFEAGLIDEPQFEFLIPVILSCIAGSAAGIMGPRLSQRRQRIVPMERKGDLKCWLWLRRSAEIRKRTALRARGHTWI
jgi:hypothetical protein